MWGLLLGRLARLLAVTGGVLEATDDPEDPEPFGLGADVVPGLQIVPGRQHVRKFRPRPHGISRWTVESVIKTFTSIFVVVYVVVVIELY